MPSDAPASRPNLTRRQFLGSAAALGAAAAMPGVVFGQRGGSDPYGGFKMGIQSFSLRAFDLETALKHTQDLGLHYWEAFSRHIPTNSLPSYIEEMKKLLSAHDVTLTAYGVISFDDNETKAREVFDFAKGMKLKSISANPQKNEATFAMLERLVDEYRIPIAIHNHGPGATYDKISDVEKWVKDRHPLIGACVDMGHYLRSDESPVDAIERLGKRVYGCHLKDAKSVNDPEELAELSKELPAQRAERLKREGKIMTIVGEGELDLVGVFRALKSIGYENPVSLEYEENAENPLSDIAVCLENTRKAIAKL